MNKRFFTLMAAAMLAGAPLANQAFAFGTPDYVVATDGDVALASGMQFYLADGTNYLAVQNGDSDGTFYTVTTTTTKANAAKFEIKAYSGGTFQLWVGGKRVYQDTGKANGVFYALNSSAVTTKFNFTSIKTFAVGSEGTDLCSGLATFAPYTKLLVLEAEDLNANLSKRGFALQFPDANSAPDVNLFGQKMVAVDASAVASVLELSGSYSNLMFAIADADGNKLLSSSFTKAQAEAATFVVVSPSKNFGITGFDKDAGEGYDLTTVKGAKLAKKNKAADGKIAIDNGIFTVTEEDMLAEAGMYTIQAAIKVNTATDETSSALSVYVGAYSLNAGGIKTYITTKTTATDLVKASTNGTSYAQATDLLSASGAAIYNISFCGTMPETKAEAEVSFYGKYLVTDIDLTSTPAYEFDAEAPADVNKKAADAQWVVTGFNGKGEFTFTNLENGKGFSAKLYKTDDADVYEFSSDDISADGTEKARFTLSSGIESFLTLTDAQLKQGATLTFHGEGSVNVNEVYMNIEKDKNTGEYLVVPSTDESDNTVWEFAKAGSVKKKLAYAYLKNGVVTAATVDTLETVTYYLTAAGYDLDLKNVGNRGANTDYQVIAQGANGAHTGDIFAFKKVDGKYVIYALTAAPAAYSDIVKENPYLLFLNKKNAQFAYNTAQNMDIDNAYIAASIDFYTLGESLPAVSRHATINSEDGAVSFKENKNGILEGIIASEGMTFWLDTADTDADMPTFYLSKGIAVDTTVATKAYSEEVRNFMLYPADLAYYWSDDKATYVTDKAYYLEGTGYTNLKAIFSPAALVAEDTLSTAAGVVTKKNGLNNYKYYITKYGEGYIVSPAADQTVFLYNLNGKLGFTSNVAEALVINLGEGDATANEAIAAESGVQVIGGEGVVTVQGAAGKVITVANILGQTIANQVATSDNVTIAVPAGIAVVSVDGEATKVVVK